MVRLLILLALWPALARAQTIDDAFPPTIRVEQTAAYGCRATVARATLDTSGAPLSWLVVELSSKRDCRGAELSIDVPAGTRVVGLGVEADGERSWSAARPVREAHAAFERERGAALLAWESTSAGQDHLRVWLPVPARLELALELPAIDHVVIDAGGRRDIDLRRVPARTTPASYAHADARTALVAGAPNREEPGRFTRRWSRTPSGGGDKASIRRGMKRNLARLTHCYERVAQWRGEIAGTITLQFLVERDGVVQRVATTQTDLPPSITSCLEAVVRDWQFEAVDGPVLVHYPLRFSTPAYGSATPAY